LSAAPARLLPWSAAARVIALLVGAGAALPACSPLVRPPNFVGARDQVTDASLIGPFDGQVVDAATAEPIAEATVVAVWSYDRGDGFIGPYGAETYSTVTDATGRYRVPPTRLGVRGSTVRLVNAQVIVYKRGYHGYRSDAVPGGGPRSDFTVRHNKVELRKWLESDSHAEHLLFLSAPRPLQKAVRWEAELANLDLYRTLGGAGGTAAAPEAPGADMPQTPVAGELLDASGLLTTEEVRQRTGYADAFEVKDLTDLKRTDFYHGVHMQASSRDERYDVALRVWRAPPGGMDSVAATIQETFAGVKPAGDITPETWTLTSEGVHAVAFVDREAQVGVLLSCGDMQCGDLDTAIILTKHVHRNLDRIKTVPAAAAPTPAAGEEQPAAPAGVPGRAVPSGGPLTPAGARPAGAPAGVAEPREEAGAGKPSGTGPSGQDPKGKSPGAGPSGQPAGKSPGTGPSGQPSTPPAEKGKRP
jgi:hypothetical protein